MLLRSPIFLVLRKVRFCPYGIEPTKFSSAARKGQGWRLLTSLRWPTRGHVHNMLRSLQAFQKVKRAQNTVA